MLSLLITGLSTGVYSGNSDFNLSYKPKFIDAFIATILFKPSIVKWALLLTSSTTCLNNKKSAAQYFELIKDIFIYE